MTIDRPTRRDARDNIVPGGCSTITTIVVLLIAVAGYFGYRYLTDALDIPAELERYTHRDTVLALVVSHAPAPAEGTRLDAVWTAFYVDGAGATGAAFEEVRRIIDSTSRAGDEADTSITATLTSPRFLRAVTLLEPLSKRALVEYLNARDRSLAQYEWAKLRVVAASGITRKSIDSALRARVGIYFGGSAANITFTSRNTDAFFRSVDLLRASGAIDSTERALVAPHRSALLERGIASVYGFDTDFED